jgi:site-specific DNA-methyltransferase (adenine-specific)
MTNAEKLLEELKTKDISLKIKDGKLKCKSPVGALTGELRIKLEQLKPEIMRILEGQESNLVTLKPFPNSLYRGDCQEILKRIPDNSIDLIVTDPPYGLEFMGKDWDNAIPAVDAWQECFRVLKPGAFAFVMCAPRSDLQCRMIDHLERAGFETGFSPIFWTHAQGMPKAHKINEDGNKKTTTTCEINNEDTLNAEFISPEATRFKGAYAGFQPKPAVEVILVVMKPLEKRGYTNQAFDNDKGITWLDKCRVGEGRFPANLLVSDGALGDYSRYFSLDSWAGKLNLAELPQSVQENLPFLIVPKPSNREKEAGLERFKKQRIRGRDQGQDKRNTPHKLRPKDRKNIHPTIKPVTLMAYLITMGSREGDVVLDPFLGSGTTAVAAVGINRRIIGIEISDEYMKIAQARFRSAFIAKHYPASQVKHEEIQDDQQEDVDEEGAGLADEEMKQTG